MLQISSHRMVCCHFGIPQKKENSHPCEDDASDDNGYIDEAIVSLLPHSSQVSLFV